MHDESEVDEGVQDAA